MWTHHTHWKTKDEKAEEKLKLLLAGEVEGEELVKRTGMLCEAFLSRGLECLFGMNVACISVQESMTILVSEERVIGHSVFQSRPISAFHVVSDTYTWPLVFRWV